VRYVEVSARLAIRRFGYTPVAIVVTAMLFVFVGVVVSHFTSQLQHWLPFLLACLVLVLTGGVVLLRVWLGGRDPLEPTTLFSLSLAVGTGLRGVYLAIGKGTFFDELPGLSSGVLATFEMSHLSLALFYSCIGICAFYAGYSNKIIAKKLATRLPVFRPVIHPRRLAFSIALYTLIGLYTLVSFLHSREIGPIGIETLSSGRVWKASGYVGMAIGLLSHATILCGILYFRRRRNLLFWVLLLLALVYPVLTSSRGGILNLVVILVTIYHYAVRSISRRKLVILFLLTLVVLSALLGLRLATYLGVEAFQASVRVEGLIGSLLGYQNFADIITFANIVRVVPAQWDLEWGSNWLTLFVKPIPRAWWPEKPVDVGITVASEIYGTRSANPPSFIADLYWNFHLPGILLGMYLFGLFARTIYSYLNLNRGNIYCEVIYAVCAVFIFKLSNSNLVPQITWLLITILPLLVAIYYSSGGFVQRELKINRPLDRDSAQVHTRLGQGDSTAMNRLRPTN